MSNEALIAEAREMLQAWATHEWQHRLVSSLADALEAATRELAFERLRRVDEQIEDAEWRAVVEAQALEQAAERMRAAHGNIWGADWIAKTLIAWAAEIREGRA